ncbi:unnamed protein product [Diatraea saccharalis]|uniref:Uncharacterized protein n=1 Tax=Diatraea saccharalis TaxID=40085 RepID=A0A9P0C5X4_9NEOP|nr:unnamed protein product [Diatraea saccharalis]
MFDLQVCRICLRDERKFYKMDKYFLKKYYEEIMALPIEKVDGLPQYFCYQCAATLYKFHLFKEKCHYSHKALTDMLWNGKVTQSAVNRIKAKQNPKLMYGTLEVVKRNKRVNTLILKHTYDEEEDSNDIKGIDAIDYSDHSYMDSECISDNVDNIEHVEPEPELVLAVDNADNTEIFPATENDVIESDPPKVEKVTKKKSKQSKMLKENKMSKTRQTRRRKMGKKKKNEETDSDDEVLANKKRSNAASERKNVEFTKAKGGKPKVLKFLDSGFWKKSFLTDEEAMAEFQAKAQDRKYLRAAFKCTDCYRGFSQKSMLERHIPLKHGEALGPLVCRFCKCRFRTAYFLNKHMRLHYTKFECLRCNLVCNIDKSALFHEEYHNGVIRKCPHCDKEFKHMSTFYTHLRTHRSKHMCPRCGESFVSELGLYLHQKVKHITDSGNIDVEGNTYCDVCKIKFETTEAYDRHLLHSAMHTEDKLLEDDTAMKEIMKDDVDMDIKDCEEIQNSEELYTRKTRVEKTLSAVRKRNLNKAPAKVAKKPTTCQHCGKHFESQSACMKHHHAEHPRKPFYSPKDRVICEICGASLAPSSVPAHLNQHTRRKMYTCDTCGRSFTTNNMLRNHIVTHTGERNHACNICGKRFAQSGSLSLHHRTVHLKQPYPKRNRRKRIEVPNTEAGPFGGKEEYRVWKHYFDNSTYSNS